MLNNTIKKYIYLKRLLQLGHEFDFNGADWRCNKCNLDIGGLHHLIIRKGKSEETYFIYTHKDNMSCTEYIIKDIL